MIDFFTKNFYDINQAVSLMKDIFGLDKDKIIVCNLKDLEYISLDNTISCLCVLTYTKGNVKTLLQIYRIEIDLDIFLNKLNNLTSKYQDIFFVPSDNFDGYFKLSQGKSIKKVVINDDKYIDGYFYFT